jgi:hypothetical protein
MGVQLAKTANPLHIANTRKIGAVELRSLLAVSADESLAVSVDESRQSEPLSGAHQQ